MDKNDIKKQLGIEVVNKLVKSGMKIGLGTGSTAVHAIRWIKERKKLGELENLLVVPTSLQAEWECKNCDIPFKCL
ncbi:MAG: ribose 5-phosphate isomerase A, partial [Spirochaetales bacterium]|nr:ribose 5-phosphate isomerase A [Spirochaetales bacterium]